MHGQRLFFACQCLVVVVFASGCHSSATNSGKAKEVVKLTAFDYYKEYKADSEATKKKYAGKILEISGIVESASNVNVAAQPQLVLKGSLDKDQFGAIVQCMFPARDEAVVNRLVAGQTVTVRGQIDWDTFGFGAPLLECELVQASESPAIKITATQLTREYAADSAETKKKYDEKPMILEGAVVSISKTDFDYTFVLAGFNETAAQPIRIKFGIGHVGMSHIKQRLAAIKKGQTIKIKGECGFAELEYPITLYKVILLR